MDQLDASGGIDTLVQRTADMVELTLSPSMSSDLTRRKSFDVIFF